MKELKIIEPTKTMKHDGKNIYFKSNLGDIAMEYGEAFEIVYTTLDAMIGVGDDRASELLEEMNRKYDLGRI